MSETLTTTSSISEQPTSHSSSEMAEDRSAEKIADTLGSLREQSDFVRAEIDTSAPFKSVREAASRFGGFGFWKPRSHEAELELEDIDIFEVDKQKTFLAAHLVEKESETFDVLKELENTNRLAGELRSMLQKEQSEQDTFLKVDAMDRIGLSALDRLDLIISDENDNGVENPVYTSPGPEVISMEINLEKMTDLSVTKASIKLLNESIANERNALETTLERLATNSLNILSLEKELNRTRKTLELVKDSEADEVSGNPTELSMEIQRLSSDTEKLKISGEAAKSELFSAMLEIEQTKSRIKIAEMSLVAANRMKEAAKQAEETALSELKRLANDECPTNDDYAKPEGVSLSREEYDALVARARDAEEISNKRVQTAMLEVDEANMSKMEMLMKVERAREDVKMTKMVMENALRRVETATMGKLAVEESLRQWRSNHSRKRHAHSNTTKFKTVGPSEYRKEHSLHDVNGVSLFSDSSVQVLRPTLSIGQILNNKLQQLKHEPGMISEKGALRCEESLGQMLGRRDENSDVPTVWKAEKANDPDPTRRKSTKFTFTRFSLQLLTQSKKKKTAKTPRFMMCKGQP